MYEQYYSELDSIYGNKKFIKGYFYEKYKFYGFKKINEDEYNKILNLAIQFNNFNNNKPSDKIYDIYKYCTLNYKIFKEKDLAFLFLVLASDPDLKMLSIHMKYSHKDEIKKASIEELGFYDAKLVEIEKYYNKKYNILEDEFDVKRTL